MDLKRPSMHKLLYRALPFLAWRNSYSAATFRSDLLAGLTVAVVLIPQAMAYAMLAGLPPVYGLYAGAITPMPGGTGPMTIGCLLQNTMSAARMLGAVPPA